MLRVCRTYYVIPSDSSRIFSFLSDGDVSRLGLSAGERQLFCLARAVVRQASLLIMDEATSNLDRNAEILLMSAAFLAFQNTTIIVIAVSPVHLVLRPLRIYVGVGLPTYLIIGKALSEETF